MGSGGQLRENSLAALTAGLERADGVETDLRLSGSSSVWLNHNADVQDAITGKSVFIHLATDKELRKVRVTGGDGQLYPLATLDQLLQRLQEPRFQDKIAVLETKAAPAGLSKAEKRRYEATIALEQVRSIEKFGVKGQVRHSSFDASMLNALRRFSPDSGRRLLTDPQKALLPQIVAARLRGASFDGFHLGTNHSGGEKHPVSLRTMRALDRLYGAMGSWSTNDPHEAQMQVDAARASRKLREFELITDSPDVITDVVHGRTKPDAL